MKNLKLFLAICMFASTFVAYSVPTYITPQMIRALNPANFNPDFSKYNQKTSLFCAHLSDAAYLSKTEITMLQYMLNQEYGNKTFQITDLESSVRSRAVLVLTDKFLIISFRGTEFNKLKDILTDGKFKNYRNSDSASASLHNLPTGHAGFRRGIMALMKECNLYNSIDSLISLKTKKRNEFPIYLTGHSMGAAYASLFAGCLISDSNYLFNGAYNFAPPLAVYCPKALEIRNSKYNTLIYDIVNYCDYIARTTKYCQTNYRHIGKFMRIAKNDTLFAENEHYVEFKRRDGKFKSTIKYHALKGYIDKLSININNEAFVEDREKKGRCFFCDTTYKPIICSPEK